MSKYKVQMVDRHTRRIEEDMVDDMIFDDEASAEEYAGYLAGCMAEGAEVLEMSDPFEFEDGGGADDFLFRVREIKER